MDAKRCTTFRSELTEFVSKLEKEGDKGSGIFKWCIEVEALSREGF